MNCRKCKKDIPEESKFCYLCGARQNISRTPKKRGNGQGSVYKVGNKYIAEVTLYYYKDSNGVRKRKSVKRTFDKKSDAIAALPTLSNQSEKLIAPTLYELHEIYTSSKKYDAISSSQRDKLKYAWNRCKPLYGKKIIDITVDDMQRVIDDAVSTYYPAKDMKTILSHCFVTAIQRDFVQYNKTEYLDLPPLEKGEIERFTDEEMDLFWSDYEKNEFTGYILIMCYAGIRYGELANIPLENIYEDYMIGGIKTEAGKNREIPIADAIKDIVKRFAEKNNRKLLEMNEDKFYASYWETIDRLGIRHLPPQTCRHTYFSMMTAAGVQIGIITKTGGHADYRTTLKNYVKLSLQEKVDAVNKMRSSKKSNSGSPKE